MLNLPSLNVILSAYGLELIQVEEEASIPASYWGEPEAGLAGRCIFARPDTPTHSLLHEVAHYVCMSKARRSTLWRNAGGDTEEEDAVCFLQVLLSDYLPGCGRIKLLKDMDDWGYTFREGSANAWFYGDGGSARRWLLAKGIVDYQDSPTWRLR
tara:strand:+ start:333 stop:797 length:465 start_codon:yes stop_codon:yes gene_type:complete